MAIGPRESYLGRAAAILAGSRCRAATELRPDLLRAPMTPPVKLKDRAEFRVRHRADFCPQPVERGFRGLPLPFPSALTRAMVNRAALAVVSPLPQRPETIARPELRSDPPAQVFSGPGLPLPIPLLDQWGFELCL